jgi:hypothetical protein
LIRQAGRCYGATTNGRGKEFKLETPAGLSI